jgi:integrase
MKPHRVKSAGRIYWYAWRGGPRIADPSTPEGAAQLKQAIDQLNAPYVQTIGDIVRAYCKSPNFLRLRRNTRRSYEMAITRILDEFGHTPADWIDRRGARGMFLQWRDEMSADAPAMADQVLMVLRTILSWAMDREMVLVNPLLKYKRVNRSARRDVIWSDEQLAIMDTFPAPLARAGRLALLTGQRQGDLLKLKWSQVGQTINLEQEKTGARVAIPVTGELASFLTSLQRTSVYVLVNSKGRPWTSNGFQSVWYHAMERFGIEGVHFHDLRGTAVCRWYQDGWSISDIAAMTGHMDSQAEQIIRRAYLPRQAAVLRMTSKTQRR